MLIAREAVAVVVGLAILLIVAGVFIDSKNTQDDMKVEYKLELVDQNTIKVYSVKSNYTYITSPDSLASILEQDNQ